MAQFMLVLIGSMLAGCAPIRPEVKPSAADVSSNARALLFHRNEVGSAFVLESITYSLDGATILTKADNNGDLAGQQEFEIFNAPIAPGAHTVSVSMQYRGTGNGFANLKDYQFKLRSNETFNVEAAKVSRVKIVGYEKGGADLDPKDKLGIRFELWKPEVGSELPFSVLVPAGLLVRGDGK